MRWVTNKHQSDYMKVRKEQNLLKSVDAEIWAAQKLKKTKWKWTRQARWGCRLFDFWCAELGVAIEIDGPSHNSEYDKVRDNYNYFRSGIIVHRVRNFDEQALSDVIAKLPNTDKWQIRKIKMREEFGLREEDSFSRIIKLIGLKKAHGDWQPQK
jgi:very-short-patch-repair endonuclease